MTVRESIAEAPLFEGLPGAQLEKVARIISEKTFGKGRMIFTDGSEARGFYVLTSGRVKVYKLSAEGREQILHFIGPGQPFGEVPTFAGERYPAYAQAVETSEALFFPREAFVALITEDPSLALNMLALLSRRLQRFVRLIEDLSLKEVPGRLAAHLLYLSQRQDDADQLTLEVTKGQLASLLGTIPETLSRILTRWVREGLIESQDNRRVRILDRQSLEELARGERRLT